MAEEEELRGRLEAVAEELADLAMARLRQSIEAGEATSAGERRLTRARRAVEKAAALLSDREAEPAE